jgi:hypothetical protein
MKTENVAEKTGQTIKWQIDLVGLSMRLLHTLQYELGTMLQYPVTVISSNTVVLEMLSIATFIVLPFQRGIH